MAGSLRHLDRLQGTAFAARVSALPLTMRAYRATRAVLVRDRVRFAVSELAGRHGSHAYRLADDGATVVVRHDVADTIVLDELFWWGFYDLPDEVAALFQPAGDGGTVRVADLGANVGLFGVWCLRRWPGARILAFEPDPDNALVCRRAIAANGAGEAWTLVQACAGTADGTVSFAAGQGAQSRVVDAGDPEATVTLPVVDALPSLAGIDLLKIDIEGSEWPLLADPRFATLGARAVLLEYHPHGAPSGDPHADAERLLRAAGYREYTVRRMPDDHGIAWAWNPA